MTKLSFTDCPKGHKLPREGCTPIYCGGDAPAALPPLTPLAKAAAKRGRSKSKTADKAKTRMPSAAVLRDKAVAVMQETHSDRQELASIPDDDYIERYQLKVGKRIAERAVRMALLKMPEGLSGADAEDWADKKAVELLPQAMAQIEYDLKYGDDSQRREAARDVLDMTGRRRRDGMVASAPTIVLNLGGGHMLPWEKASAQVATGTATRIEAGQSTATGNGPVRALEVDAGRKPGSG